MYFCQVVSFGGKKQFKEDATENPFYCALLVIFLNAGRKEKHTIKNIFKITCDFA